MPLLPRTDKSRRAAPQRLAAAAACALALAVASAPAAAQGPYADPCGSVTLAEFSWPTARLVSATLERLLTDGFGCAVDRSAASPGQAPAAVIGFAARDEVVVAPGLAAETLPPDPLLRRGAPTITGAREGVFMPDWMQTANPEIETLSDALRAADRFRLRDAERPVLSICPESWACHAETRRVAEELGFAEVFEIVTPPSGDALIQSLIDAHQNRRPWLGYFWTPSATAATHPIVELAAGAARLCDAAAQHCREPFPPRASVTVYGAPLDQRVPAAAAFLQRFSVPAEAAMEALAWRARTNASIEQTADYLLARSPASWRALLPGNARAAFEQALSARMTGIVD